MAEEHPGNALQKHLGAVDEVLQTVERFKEQRSAESPPSLSRRELDILTKRLNALGKVQPHEIHQAKTETRIDATVNGVRAKVSVPNDPSSVSQTLRNLESRTKASDLFTLSILSSNAAETFSQKERDDFLRLTKDRRQLQKRFSQTVADHPAIRKRDSEIWENLAKGQKILGREDWRQQLGLGNDSSEVRSGLDAFKNDAIRQAKFVAFVRSMEGHKDAFHRATNPREQQAIMNKAEERIAAFSKGLPLSEKAEVRKQGLGFIKSLQAKTNDLKSAVTRKLSSAPRISIIVKRGNAH